MTSLADTLEALVAKATAGEWLASLVADSAEQRSIYGPNQEQTALVINGSAIPGRTTANAAMRPATDAELVKALEEAKSLIEKLMRDGGLVSVPIASWTSEARSEAKSLWCVPTWHLGDAEIVVRDARDVLAKTRELRQRGINFNGGNAQ